MWTIFVTELEALRIEMIDKPFWGLFENPSSTHGPPPHPTLSAPSQAQRT